MEGTLKTKWCAKCGTETEHYVLRGQDKGCARCQRERARKFRTEHREERNARERRTYAKDPEKGRARNRRYVRLHPERQVDWTLRKKYGIGLSEFNARLESQAGLCAICQKQKRLTVDHDHKTGDIRGLVCIRCNVALAALGDNSAGVFRALSYLLAAEATRLKEIG